LDELLAPVTVQLEKLPAVAESPRMFEGCSSPTLNRNPSVGSTVVAVTGVFAADISNRFSSLSIPWEVAAKNLADLVLRRACINLISATLRSSATSNRLSFSLA
jgi:hypothetical protein